jgi:hypothetical protein
VPAMPTLPLASRPRATSDVAGAKRPFRRGGPLDCCRAVTSDQSQSDPHFHAFMPLPLTGPSSELLTISDFSPNVAIQTKFSRQWLSGTAFG